MSDTLLDQNLDTFISATTTTPDATFTTHVQPLLSQSPTFTLLSAPFLTSTKPSHATSSSTPLGSEGQSSNLLAPVCAGSGLDVSADGILAIIVVFSILGSIIGLVFAILRTRLRHVYALREWFVQQDLRPKPLSSSLFAFLWPPVPLVPTLPSDYQHGGYSGPDDLVSFPSDEQLSQRSLWVAFLVTLGWSVIGLAGGLPLYLINTPCNSQVIPTTFYGGAISTLLDLSILRLLRLFDFGYVSSGSTLSLLTRRDVSQRASIHIIVTTVLSLTVGLLPALWLVLREFNKLAEYRQRWIETKCDHKEMGWLSIKKAPGFVGWGEKRLKEFIISLGLASELDTDAVEHSNRARASRKRKHRKQRTNDYTHQDSERAQSEVDIQMLFSIGDTHQLALLIDERDAILENLEMVETKYTTSFRLTTPDPSILDFEPMPSPPEPKRPYISSPRPLGAHKQGMKRPRAINRALASSSLAPTSFVAPSQYYKLRSIHGVTNGRLTAPSQQDADGDMQPYHLPEPSFSDAFNSRIIGSRFFEVEHNSTAHGRIPLGSHLPLNRVGQPSRTWNPHSLLSEKPLPRPHGVNQMAETASWDDRIAQELNRHINESYTGVSTESGEIDDGWVDIARTAPVNFGDDYASGRVEPQVGLTSTTEMGLSTSVPKRTRRSKQQPEPPSQRETFPLRQGEGSEPISPPHLRLQPAQPFVRPMDGVSFDDLDEVYASIIHWRSKLKSVNAEIEEIQMECYNDIADGSRIKGWLMVGRGLKHIPGIEIIEGRTKEDIRWDVLQNERNTLDATVLWAIIGVVAVLLAAGLTAASGLSLATAPDVAHFLPFLRPLLNYNMVASGVATVVAPAVAITIFIFGAAFVVDWAANVYGCISISATQLFVFKTTFLLSVTATIWLVTVSALIFSLQAFSNGVNEVLSVANGAISASVLLLAIVIVLAFVSPAILLLQPLHVWGVTRALREAVTPRQRFRAMYPQAYNPSFALGASAFSLIIASTFWLTFPIISPPVSILLLLTLAAHRYLVGYVYARTHSQTGGLLQLYFLKRFGTLLALQPILLGLIFLSRRFWIEGGVLLGAAGFIILFVEVYTTWKIRSSERTTLSAVLQDSIKKFSSTAKELGNLYVDGQVASVSSTARGTRIRGSMASVLDMMSMTLAVMPAQFQGVIPLRTETIDDLTATERAARTHPDAPPHLPPLSFTEHADDMRGILYAPELIAPRPIIWLPNDSAKVARSEAQDLQRYHGLQATLDARENGAMAQSSSR
ncbi:hypothetical protein AMATHDRAFT_79843 [Amanita thiersii Skay4041]|uniref:CSC1/OSCA1-like 7TM region domain-containing protein n=1 Tax=Amanita thiersii Skay4041 TaxID=703135 RepID=A0A2A9NP75_9AGAR|nr:hypothetical protein AMATHDRAFT_79843 [Amanita thiersii Skay4041]